MPRLLVSSGETSGDLYGAELVRHLTPARGPLDVFGLGGDLLAAQGSRLVAHARDLAVVGLFEVVTHLRRIRRVFKSLLAEVDQQRPDAAVLIDYPDFNLRLAKELHRRAIPVIYYVSPQVWAWRRGRVRAIRDTVARMLVIFPFEEALYREAGVPVSFVGHPLVDRVRKDPDGAGILRTLGLDPGRPMVALLPGSRAQEIAHHLPGLVATVARLRAARPDLQFTLALAPSLEAGPIAAAFAGQPVQVVPGRVQALLSACTTAIVASGTATVEAALLEAPMVVVYRLSRITYALGRRLVKVPHVAMANLIAGRRLVPELIQGGFTPERTADEVLGLLDDGDRRRAMVAGLQEVRARLGQPGASARAAAEVAALLGQNAK
jgi:lipid-A-disaccharide synthase